MNQTELTNLLTDIHDIVFDVGPHGEILFANPAAAKTSGYSIEEMRALNFSQVVAPEFVQLLDLTLRAVRSSRSPADSELQLSGKSGNRIWLRARFRPLDSAAVRVVGQDLSDTVTAEMRVRQIEEHFRAAFQTPADAVAINRISDGAYVEINEGFTVVTGYSREEVMGKTSLELGVWADPKEREILIERLRQDGAVRDFEGHFRRKSGLVEPGLMSARIVMLSGEPHILSVTRDMAAWNLAERALAEREERLAEALQLSRTLMAAIEQAAEDITITDLDGNIQYCNPSFQRVTGYSASEIIGKNPRFLKSGRHGAEFYRQMWEAIQDGRTWNGRFTNRRRDGRLIVEDATISPITSTTGKLQGYVAVKRDVTEQLELEARYYQAQKLESIGRLAGGVAHDFNNLLTVILGYSRLILERASLDGRGRVQMEEILKAGERASALTAQLLAFSRKQVIEPRPLDLSAVVQEAERMLRRVLGEDIDLETRTTPGAAVMADPGQMHQVLMNLAVNSRDAMPSGGKLSIATELIQFAASSTSIPPELAPGPYVLLTVADSGVGMTDEVLAHVFEPFFTTKEDGKGTGLGLATVYGIVRQNHGAITIDSEPGTGTTVRIYLPRIQPDAQ